LLGAAIIVLGIWQADAWSFLGLRQILGLQEQPQTAQLVVSGLYRWVRHPLYTGGLLLIWLLPVMTANLLALFICLSIYLVVGAHFEESRLIHEFGESYLHYRQQVPMLIPFPRKR
jgi:protein-S-isoprenylcysteine O-methyltransferase Ste14